MLPQVEEELQRFMNDVKNNPKYTNNRNELMHRILICSNVCYAIIKLYMPKEIKEKGENDPEYINFITKQETEIKNRVDAMLTTSK